MALSFNLGPQPGTSPAATTLMRGDNGEIFVFRVLLLIIVLVVGYDAIVHQGAYTRDAWNSIVRLTQSSVEGAKDLGERARD
jgi:hypothetical protein